MDLMALRRRLLMMQGDKSLINWDRTLGTPNPTDVSGATSPRVMDTQHYYKGIQASNYYYSNYVKDYSVGNKTVTVTFSGGNQNYGVLIPVEITPGESYKFSATQTENARSNVSYYDANWNYIGVSSYSETWYKQLPKTFTTPNNAKYACLWFGATNKDELATYTNVMLEKVS